MVEWKKFLQKSKSRRPSDSTNPISVPDPVPIAVSSAVKPKEEINEVFDVPVSPEIPISDRNGNSVPDSKSGSVSGSGPSESAPKAESVASPGGSSNPDRPDLLPDDVRNYFYPNLDMDGAKKVLQGQPVGTFLLRQSKSSDAKYTLSIRSEKHVFNVRIFQRLQTDGGYHLDAPRHMRKYFSTISELLRYYSNSPKELIALCAGEEGIDERTTFRLKYPLSKSESTLNLAAAGADAGAAANAGEDDANRRQVTRQPGGSLKAMVKWL